MNLLPSMVVKILVMIKKKNRFYFLKVCENKIALCFTGFEIFILTSTKSLTVNVPHQQH